jgi:hypothetical protein
MLKKGESLSELKRKAVKFRQQVLLAALECSGGDLKKTFSVEDLLLKAWERDRIAWGLRGHELIHPDSEKMRAEIDRANVRGGMVGLGLLERVGQRTYRLTAAGLAAASILEPADPSARQKAHRALEDAVKGILAHPVFLEWLKDSARPKHFREAGHFWGVAPGTPSRVIRERVQQVEHTLRKALELLDAKGVEEIGEKRAKLLYERQDIERCLDFQAQMKARFSRDLRLLGAEEILVADS